MTNAIETLANQMGVRKSDAISFVACLSVWTSKGFTPEQAIDLHMKQMMRLAENCLLLDAKQICVSTFFA